MAPRTSGMHISVTDEKSLRVAPLIVMGAIAVFFGVFIFYGFPLALLTRNYSLILNVVFIDFLGYFLGLALMSLNLQSLLQWGLCELILCCEKRSMRQMVLKNLVAHKRRN